MRRTGLVVVLASFAVAVLTACGAQPAAAPATVTSTARTTVRETVSVTLPAQTTSSTSDDDALMCGVILRASDHLEGVTRNYLAKDGSAPVPFVREVAQEASDTFKTVGGIYLGTTYSEDLRTKVRLFDVAVLQMDTASSEDVGVVGVVTAYAALRSECGVDVFG